MERPADQTPPRRRRRLLLRYALPAVLIVAAVLAGVRLALPTWIERYVNGVLDQSPEYDGRIGRVTLHLWRGAYAVEDVKIVKTENAVPVPFFECPRVRFAIDWDALWNGAVRGRVRMDNPRLNFVHGPTEDTTQTGTGQTWLPMLEDLFPFRIDKARIVQGEVHFRAFHTDPPVDVFLSELDATVENLTNVQGSVDPMMATVRATGVAMDSGEFELDVELDPTAHRPTFTVASRLLGLDVNRLNELAQAYGSFDFEGGTFDLVVEATARNGFLDGYAKPLFRDVQVIALEDIGESDPLQALWEALVSVVGEVLSNQPREQFGTRITIQGDLTAPRTSVLEIIGNVLYNAFVQAYLPRLEGHAAPDVAVEEAGDGDGAGERRETASTGGSSR